MTSLKQQ